MAKASPRRSLFDHSPMAPPIVHPVKVSITAGHLLHPGTLEKGGYGLSRPGGNLGFRVEGLGFTVVNVIQQFHWRWDLSPHPL